MTLNEAIEKLNELEKAGYALGHAQSIRETMPRRSCIRTATPSRRRIPGKAAGWRWPT